ARAAGALPVPAYPGDALAPARAAALPEGEPFPMHAVPRTDIAALIARHGGTLLHAEEDVHAGADWVSYTYMVGTLTPGSSVPQVTDADEALRSAASPETAVQSRGTNA
ncbi:MAG: hypothetical protein M3R55_02865, partial [Acidobacteriota bacterium]|nr:hypothetical protein [Acidobacteriota bacterium]